MGLRRGYDLGASALLKGVLGSGGAVASVGPIDLVVDHPHVQLPRHAVQRALCRHTPGAVVVHADVRRHMTGVDLRVDVDDNDPRLRGGVDGGGVCLVVDGGEDDGLGTVGNGILDQGILPLKIFLVFGGCDDQINIIFGGRRLCAGKNRIPEL